MESQPLNSLFSLKLHILVHNTENDPWNFRRFCLGEDGTVELARGVDWFALARNKLENLEKRKILSTPPTLISGLCALFFLTVSAPCDRRLSLDPPSTATDFHCILLSDFQLPSQTFFSADTFLCTFRLYCEVIWLAGNSFW